ncbi:precorrin-6y C5,15-methyltransferase (decarboxylating) subunit CbiE [Pelagibacterium lentulum]|uniref:Precorrin-6Y methyltransferase n=1 Tax=Pelagibacterium lentulum TaxID=2029865 RepID=A0A916VXK1_9HYPH|nr:precorrin-6y C5,15-methyltransferase (decarboxylating) subunit CbiE [Pelagibacterium lentulum]GGA49399.1 precorrin-6Y methyltransferase [Pelagibacterium lentulum]
MTEPWLTIVGIGEDGLDGITGTAKTHIGKAEIVFGGERHLRLAKGLGMAEQRRWQSPLSTSIEELMRLRGRKQVCILASGDPFFYGIGSTLAEKIPATEMRIYPAPSAFSLAGAKIGWPLQDVTMISLHGRPVELVRPHLHPGRKILALTSDENGPAEIASYLTEHGFGPSRLTVLEALGGPDERVRQTEAARLDCENVSRINILGIEPRAMPDALVISYAPGLPDSAFEHDGQITKREIRALTISALAPASGQLLWDIGAGSGSVGIEWMLMHPSLSAIAIEPEAKRLNRIAENAAALGVPGLQLCAGAAPAALDGLATPDAVFIGGGGTDDGVVDTAIKALKPGGRLVANAVTTEMETLLSVLYGELGGRLTRVQIARAEPLGQMHGWRPAMPITQWVWIKPRDAT